MVKTTIIINDNHPIAPYVAVVDANGEIIRRVKSYNTETCEAEIYATDEHGKVITDWNNPDNPTILPSYPNQPTSEYGKHIRIEKKILEGSKLVFRMVAEVMTEDVFGVPTDSLDMISINCYRRSLLFLSEKDGVSKIYDEIDQLSRKYDLGWTALRTEADEKEETYKRKLVMPADSVSKLNQQYNDSFDILPMQLMSTTDKRQYAVDIHYRNSGVKHNDLAIILDMEFTPEDTAESIHKQIIETALRIQFPGDLEFDPSTYHFHITRL